MNLKITPLPLLSHLLETSELRSADVLLIYTSPALEFILLLEKEEKSKQNHCFDLHRSKHAISTSGYMARMSRMVGLLVYQGPGLLRNFHAKIHVN